jgi:hypothetical protein
MNELDVNLQTFENLTWEDFNQMLDAVTLAAIGLVSAGTTFLLNESGLLCTRSHKVERLLCLVEHLTMARYQLQSLTAMSEFENGRTRLTNLTRSSNGLQMLTVTLLLADSLGNALDAALHSS